MTHAANRFRGIRVKMGVDEKENLMAWERKIMRIVRVRNSQKKGVLAKLLTAIAEAGGNTGSLMLLSWLSIWRGAVRWTPRRRWLTFAAIPAAIIPALVPGIMLHYGDGLPFIPIAATAIWLILAPEQAYTGNLFPFCG